MGVGLSDLSKLESLRLPFGMTVERDLYTSGKIVRDFLTDYEFIVDKTRVEGNPLPI